jgi:hypothetical protein
MWLIERGKLRGKNKHEALNTRILGGTDIVIPNSTQTMNVEEDIIKVYLAKVKSKKFKIGKKS